jgi:hypothetical protein
LKWLVAFLFTQAVELPFWILAQRRGGRRPGAPPRPSLGTAALVGLGASALTHPIVWFVFPSLQPWIGYWPMVALAELFAVGVEAAYIRAEGVRHGVVWSLAANAASFALGIAILWPIWRSG